MKENNRIELIKFFTELKSRNEISKEGNKCLKELREEMKNERK